jgi:hypothetical protein
MLCLGKPRHNASLLAVIVNMNAQRRATGESVAGMRPP